MNEKNKYEYGPNDKPQGKATVVPDVPLEVFPSENETVD